jgi:enamine deaminase RidA (YjgF/YER057c/UK114 family)
VIQRIGDVAGNSPIGPYSQAVVAGGFAFTSGHLPAGSPSGEHSEPFGDKVRRTLISLGATLHEAGSSWQNVVKVNSYLTKPDQLEEYNEVYQEFFPADLPARTTICVDIFGIDLEIECIAVVAT